MEKIWSAMKRSLGNLPARTATTLATAVKNRLEKMQYRHGLMDGYLTGKGLSPPVPTRPDRERSLVAACERGTRRRRRGAQSRPCLAGSA